MAIVYSSSFGRMRVSIIKLAMAIPSVVRFGFLLFHSNSNFFCNKKIQDAYDRIKIERESEIESKFWHKHYNFCKWKPIESDCMEWNTNERIFAGVLPEELFDLFNISF